MYILSLSLQLCSHRLSYVVHCANGSVLRHEAHAAGDNAEKPQGSQFSARQYQHAFTKVCSFKYLKYRFIIPSIFQSKQ